MIQVYPAVDIRGGLCVRLERGRFDRETVFSKDPADMVRRWVDLGAALVHVVDLDGARSGSQDNALLIEAMAHEGLPLQVGGGIRSYCRARRILQAGVQRIVVGTAAVDNEQLLRQLLEEFGDRVVVGVDCRDRRVSVEGWRRQLSLSAREFCVHLADLGVSRVVVTDIERDGMLQGPSLEPVRDALSSGLRVIASGGVGRVRDLHRLEEFSRCCSGLEGVIVGRALYDGSMSPQKVLRRYGGAKGEERIAGQEDHPVSGCCKWTRGEGD